MSRCRVFCTEVEDGKFIIRGGILWFDQVQLKGSRLPNSTGKPPGTLMCLPCASVPDPD